MIFTSGGLCSAVVSAVCMFVSILFLEMYVKHWETYKYARKWVIIWCSYETYTEIKCCLLEMYAFSKTNGIPQICQPRKTLVRWQMTANCWKNLHQKTQISKIIFRKLCLMQVWRKCICMWWIFRMVFPLYAFSQREKQACNFIALLLSDLSLRVCREPAPSTLDTGSNYRLNHFITNSTFSLFSSRRNCRHRN